MSFFGRSELGDTNDPTELVPGNVATLTKTADGLRKLSTACQEAYVGVSKLDMGHWTGEAAEKFDSYFAAEKPKWRDAAEAFGPVVDALTTYKGAVERAQRDAAEAIRIYNEAKAATKAAEDQYDAAASQHNKAAVAAQFSGDPAPAPMAPFSDPGKAKREEAERLLADARRALRDAGAQAAAVVNKAKDRAPAEPGFLSKVVANLEDVFNDVSKNTSSFGSNLIKSGLDLVKLVRSGNPLDPYNITHPGEFVANMTTQAAGMVHMVTHPGEAASSILNFDQWKKDPFGALGKLTGDIAIAVATDGAGLAGNVSKVVAREAVEMGAREAVEMGAREAAKEAAEQAGRQVGKHADDAPWMKPDFDPETHTPDYNPHQDVPDVPRDPDPPAQREPDPPAEEPKREPDERPKVREPEDLPPAARDQYFQLQASVRRIEDGLQYLTNPADVAHQRAVIAQQQQQMRDIMARHS